MPKSLYPALLALVSAVLLGACTPLSGIEPTPTPSPEPIELPNPTRVPGYLNGVLDFLDQEYGIARDQARILSLEAVDWPDSCLGVYYTREACLDVITPGFRAVLDTPQGEFEFHTDVLGEKFRLASGPSGVLGQALVGPTCPVARLGTDCPDQPIEALITVLDSGGKQAALAQTGPDGYFQIFLKPGLYTLRPQNFTPFPVAGDQEITVTAGEVTQVVIHYDSGIR